MKLRLTVDSQSFEVNVGDLNARPVLVTVEGDTFEVWPEENGTSTGAVVVDAAPALISPAAPFNAPAVEVVDKTRSVLAPIPGVILSIAVKPGDTITFGQELCILEAMKMKNLIRANRSGKIETVCVAPDEQVRHSQVLMEYAD